jgi:hypothetical protein
MPLRSAGATEGPQRAIRNRGEVFACFDDQAASGL